MKPRLSIFSSDDFQGAVLLVARSCALLGIISVGLIAFIASQLGGRNDDSYIAAFADKIALLKNSERPRLVVVGGSNAAFSVRARQLASGKGYHPVNLGLSVRVPFEVFASLLDRHLERGDRVLFSLEHAYLSGELSPGTFANVANIAFFDPRAALAATGPIASSHPGQVMDEALPILSRFLKGAVRLVRGVQYEKHPLMQRSRFDEVGDLVLPDDISVERLEVDPVTPVPRFVLAKQMKKIAAHLTDLRARGIESAVALAPHMPDHFRQDAEWTELAKRHGLPMILPVEQTRYDEQAILDVTYHLKPRWAREHTRKLAQAMFPSPARTLSGQDR